MKPMLHRLTAPSSATLSFLRAQIHHAFEYGSQTNGPRCAALKAGNARYASTSRAGATIRRSAEGYLGCSRAGLGRSLPGQSSVAPLLKSKSSQCIASQSANGSIPRRQHFTFPNASSFSQCRQFSCTSTNQWSLWPTREKKRRPMPSVSTSPLAGLIDDGTNGNSLGRVSRPANELKMRCTELDGEGNVTMVSGEFKKTELIAKVHILFCSSITTQSQG